MSESGFADILLGLMPMLLLIGAWWFFMRRMNVTSGSPTEHFDLLRRQTEAPERIAKKLESRP